MVMPDAPRNQASADAEPVAVPPHTLAGEAVDHSRRRFTSAGVAASGVVLTLASRSALAAADCKMVTTPSAFASCNTSAYGPGQQQTQGRSPGFWKNDVSSKAWPVPQESLFKNYFSCWRGSPYAGQGVTLYYLLDHRDFDVDNLGMHLVAALLNARMGWTPFLSESIIRSMFTEWQSTGGYKPSATANPWNSAEIVMYLKATML
ncbi:hypothetical protein SAMN06265795_10712 [Noviherbaspirillum humi]|uniref:Uncharacterized protein n=1 Tax=Noviherbaspirillum humi TaxID=1688639 RepID=A0A239HKD8_9BURK|nr:hypothetical protein [Noviherbaspirillum humi]SNS81293.1 hypothetical protein SAMN06265795_10712 [Noviherbaspirillum humi]